MKNWLNSPNVCESLKNQIRSYNEEQLNIAFNTKIEFGTAGMRGTMGAGDGYFNENIVNWATIGYAKYLNSKFANPKVVIAYDNRLNSDKFAKLCANVLSNFGIEVYIFDKLTSTPQLSYTIREISANGGINITASHNPKSDNGYKLYNEQGCQYLPEDIAEIINYINEIESPIDSAVYNEGISEHITILKSDESTYLNYVASITNSNFNSYESVLLTPLHGCSASALTLITNLTNFENIYFVEEQMKADASFTTAASPNPDSKESYEFALKNNQSKCRYILANDPDADRVGVYDVENDCLFTGNQIATLIMQYLIDTNQYSNNMNVVTSVVSSSLPLEIAKKHGLNIKVVLTGFKYIGSMMDNKFLFGYEESNGYLLHDKTRDKDGIASAFKIIEMINYYFNNGISLYEKLESIYKEYFYLYETQTSIFVNNSQVVEKVFNSICFNTFDNIKCIENYQTLEANYENRSEKINLPKTNMLKVIFNDNSWFAIRPSGTEPKIKVYYNICDNNLENAKKRFITLKETVHNMFN